ncbi:glycosyltransferase family 15 protein [Phaffia rhodozyma]|uniref:Glycosyltransferase family 15 protein n=1 Tax=Phaffia rhodozyma TaxID=264483 RepID=A0A0F7SV73_PHARH|nr:glycosyltransferase family 15 protein [Phaffia rhodozyma]
MFGLMSLRSPLKLIPLIFLSLFAFHFLLSALHQGYADTASGLIAGSKSSDGKYGSGGVKPHPSTWRDLESAAGNVTRSGEKVNAAFVILARNSDLWSLADSIKQMERAFNHWANYPYVFLNEEPFSEEFKQYTQGLTKARCSYGLIEPDHWRQPSWINEEKASAAREEMIKKKVIYGHSVPYRNMCRFNSGFFYRHPLLANVDYYWRIEPGVKFFCDLPYDPFLVMKQKKAVYGFTLSLLEYIETIPTLWQATMEFMKSRPDLKVEGNAEAFLSDDGGAHYNLCHFWSNFELGDLNFWRSEPYQAYFDFLDAKGGFYYERWGDAPVHSIGAALFAKKEQILWFSDIGYRHEPFQHCPQGEEHTRGKCSCNPKDNFDWEWYSCTKRFTNLS